MARKNTIGSALIVASIMLAVAVLGSGYFLSQSIQRGTQELRKLSVRQAELAAQNFVVVLSQGGRRRAVQAAAPRGESHG